MRLSVQARRIGRVLAAAALLAAPVSAATRGAALTIPTTTGGGVANEDVAYDPYSNAYLAVTGKGKVQGAWVNANGTLNGSTFNLTTATPYQQSPSVACGSGGVCLAVWHEGSNGTAPMARLLSLSGGLLTTPVALGPIGSNWTMTPGVAYSPTADLFMVTWMGDYLAATNLNNIWIALVDSTGHVTYSGRLTTGNAYERQPSVGYNPTSNEFVVTYCGVVSGGAFAYTAAQRVDTTGASVGSAVTLDQAGGAYLSSIDYDQLTQAMFVTWNRGTRAIYGRQFNADGTIGPLLTVTSSYGTYDALDSAYNPITKSFLLVTHSSTVEDEALEVSSGLATLGAFVLTANGGTGNFNPRVASSTVDPSWMADTSKSFATLVAQFATGTAEAGNDVGPPPPPPCGVSTSPGSSNASGFGASNDITVTVPSPPCSWTAVTNAGWLGVNLTSGTTSQTVTWTAQANNTGVIRSATVNINGNITTITQDAVNHPLQFDATLGGDFLGYNPTTGAWAEKLYNGTPFANGGSGAWSQAWQILPAKFNTDGLVDLFFYNPTNGAWRKAANMGNGTFTYYFPPANLEAGWKVIVLDLDGDGLSDVFLYNATTGAWKRGMSTTPGATGLTFTTGTWAAGWQLFKANFNGDARADLFLYNQSSGQWAKAITQSDLSFTIVSGDTTWEAGWQVYPGDYDGDGITHLFLYRSSDGHAMHVTFTNGSATYTSDTWAPGWTVRAGDLNADGKTDLFLYNPTNGAWAVATSDGSGGFTTYNAPSAVGTAWDLRVVYLDTDGAADVLWYQPTTGQTRVWLMQDASNHTEILGPAIGANLSLVTDLPTALTFSGGLPYPVPVCSVATSPGASSASGFGGTGNISVTTGLPSCGWTAVSNAAWLSVSPPSGSSAGTVTWTADPNTTGAPRTATVTIAGNVTSIVQSAQLNPLQFDGSSGGDFLTYKSSTGAWATKLYNGTPFTTGGSGSWSTGWQIQGARFNTDGLVDLFYYNPGSGAWRKGLNLGGGTFSIYFPPANLDTGRTATLLDLNGDGLSDLFLYNPTTGAWKSGIATAGATNFTYTTGTWAAGWQVFRANFNNDRRDDLFLYNPTTGAWARVLTQANGTFSFVNGDTTWEANWQVFPGDFNGDGITDLFLYRGSDGHVMRVTFTSNSATYQSATWATGLTIRTGDLGADGKTDVFAYNPTDGSWGFAISNGSGLFDTYNNTVSQNVGTGWVPYVEYFDTDNKADILWYKPTTGETMEWLIQDPTALTYTSVVGPTLATGLTFVSDPP